MVKYNISYSCDFCCDFFLGFFPFFFGTLFEVVIIIVLISGEGNIGIIIGLIVAIFPVILGFVHIVKTCKRYSLRKQLLTKGTLIKHIPCHTEIGNTEENGVRYKRICATLTFANEITKDFKSRYMDISYEQPYCDLLVDLNNLDNYYLDFDIHEEGQENLHYGGMSNVNMQVNDTPGASPTGNEGNIGYLPPNTYQVGNAYIPKDQIEDFKGINTGNVYVGYSGNVVYTGSNETVTGNPDKPGNYNDGNAASPAGYDGDFNLGNYGNAVNNGEHDGFLFQQDVQNINDVHIPK